MNSTLFFSSQHHISTTLMSFGRLTAYLTEVLNVFYQVGCIPSQFPSLCFKNGEKLLKWSSCISPGFGFESITCNLDSNGKWAISGT